MLHCTPIDYALRLQEAERSHEQIAQISRGEPAMSIGDGYDIQQSWIDLKLAEGRRVVGHKIGLTSKAMQSAAQIDEPDYGVLLDDMLYSDGDELPYVRFIEPRIEVELAFTLKSSLPGKDCTVLDVLRATEYVMPALEVIDARIERFDADSGSPRTVNDTISDNAASAAVILGGRAVEPTEVDLRWVSALCYRQGVIEETGVAAGVLNHPAAGVSWLARKLAAHDVELEPGHIVLSGSFTRPISVRSGDVYHVDYGLLGSVACRFAPAPA